MVLRHQRLKREQDSGAGHGGDMGKPYDVDKASFPVWRREVGLPDDICYQVEGRLPDKQSTPKKVSQKASVVSELAGRIEKKSRSQSNPIASQSQKALMVDTIVSQHQKVPMVRLAAVSQRQKEPMVSPVAVSQKAFLVRSAVSQYQKAPMANPVAVSQYKKVPMA
jgi:hypothetical protein